MYYMSGATLRLIGEKFDPQPRFSQMEQAEIKVVESVDLSGQRIARNLCSISSPFLGRDPKNFDNTLAFFSSEELGWKDAGRIPHVEISDLLISVMVHPLTGARFKLPASFFRALDVVCSTLSIDFINDLPGEPINTKSDLSPADGYDCLVRRSNLKPYEADLTLRELLGYQDKLKEEVSIALILTNLSARSKQTARFNLSLDCIRILASRGLSIRLDVFGAASGGAIARKHKKKD